MILYPFAFYGTAMCLAVVELAVPRRQSAPVSRRWVTNIGLFVFSLFVQRICAPLSVIFVAEAAIRSGNGIFQLMGGPGWVIVLLGVLLLDFWKYVEHRLSHRISILWRLHLVHHSDVDADFTTTERHHPLEIIVGLVGTIAVIYLFGIPPLAVVIYLLFATVIAFFSHANIRLSNRVDRWLRCLVVTPGVHVVHHSAASEETDSNFGLLLTVWDRIFGTYRTSTPADDAKRVIGLEYFRDERSGRLDQALCQPFRFRDVRRLSHAAESEGVARVLR
jgi:sterol desaturase/sphingolipid hydroxylase (fatty acid hydroxylase superfamily)